MPEDFEAPTRGAPRVLISYAHDDLGHESQVHALYQLLRSYGIDAVIDLEAADRPQYWPDWMSRQIRENEFILVIGSPQYRQSAEGLLPADQRKGVRWEARMLKDLFYADEGAARNRILPVLLPGRTAADLPDWLSPGAATHYEISELSLEGVGHLLRVLTDQPSFVKPPLGPPTVLPTGQTIADIAVKDRAWPPTNLPRRNPLFTGRIEALKEISSKLKPAVAVVIRGLGGVGKSQLVLEYAHRRREERRYRLVWWVRAESAVTISEDIAELGSSLGIPPTSGDPDAVRAVLGALTSRQDWLLVFDNATDAQSVIPYLPQGGGHVLLTSRYRGWGAAAHQIEATVFKRAESVVYLNRRAGRKDEMAADALAALLGDLPLALAQAAAYIDLHGLSTSGYGDLYRNKSAAGALLAQGLETEEYPASVATTWLLHFDRLSTDSPASQDLLRLCSYLSPDDVNLDLILANSELLPESLRIASSNAIMRETAIGRLAATSLVDRIEDHRIKMHRLVQEVTRNQLGDASGDWATRALQVVMSAFTGNVLDASDWARFADLTPHVLSVLLHTEGNASVAHHRADLRLNYGSYLIQRAEYDAALESIKNSLDAFVGMPKSDLSKVLDALNHLGIAKANLGDLNGAEDALSEVAKRSEAAYGPASITLSTSLTNLAMVILKRGHLAKAAANLERALEIWAQRSMLDDPRAAVVMDNLATVYRDMGQVDRAISLQEKALDVWREAYGVKHLEVARALGNLGTSYHHRGGIDRALALHKQALALFRELHSEAHPEIADATENVGWDYEKIGDTMQARRYFEAALSVLHEIYSPNHWRALALSDRLRSLRYGEVVRDSDKPS